jgi:hypothetical protein
VVRSSLQSEPPPDAARNLKKAVLARSGRWEGEEIRFRCPHPRLHRNEDANPSARYNPDRFVWYCDACGKGGGWKELCDVMSVSLSSGQRPRSRPTAYYVYLGEDGKPLRRKVRWEPGFDGRPKSFTWEKLGSGEDWTTCTGGGNPGVLYHSEELPAAREAGTTVWVVEGEKDADAAKDLGLLAVTNPEGAGPVKGKARRKGKTKWKQEYSQQLRGLPVVVLPDKDSPGRAHGRAVARSLHRVAPSVRLLELPGERVNDLSNWLAAERDAGRSDEEIRGRLEELMEAAGPSESSEGEASRPLVIVGPDEKRVNDEALEALAERSDLYTRGGLLVRILRDEGPEHHVSRPEGAPRIVAVPSALLREMLAESVNFRKRTGEGEFVPVSPPASCVRALAARGHWPLLRPLEAVTQTPLLLPDGSVLQEPGYDRATGIYFLPKVEFPVVPDRPTSTQVNTAQALLREAVCDFPFAQERHLSAFLAAVLTILSRHAFSGPAPLALVDANTRGSGKGLLVDVAGRISTGQDVPRMAYSREAEEQRKAILSLALEGCRVALIDNVAGGFGSATLDAALTATVWTDRILGASKTATVPLTIVWFATGNNVAVVGDTVRRCLYIRLESPNEHPERRQGFQHPRLLEWVERNRGELTAAGLTLLRAYIAAGRPDQRLLSWGSFEGWSDLVRSCLVWLGLPDPGETRGDLYDSASGEDSTLGNLVAGLTELFQGLDGECGTAREILQVLQGTAESGFGALRDALAELVPRPAQGDLPSTAQLGSVLKRNRGRVLGGRAIEHTGQGKTKRGVVWCVKDLQGDAGDADSPHLFSRPATPLRGDENGNSREESPSPASPASPPQSDGGMERWQI